MQNNPAKSNIVLVGFMGAGKTTIGKALAEELEYPFIDSDAEIEKQEGISINEVFRQEGESYFRGLENNFLNDFHHSSCVLSTGGGMPVNGNMELLKQFGTVFYINTPFKLILERLRLNQETRPLCKSESGDVENDLNDLFLEREKIYKLADFEIDGSLDVSEIKNQIKKRLAN